MPGHPGHSLAVALDVRHWFVATPTGERTYEAAAQNSLCSHEKRQPHNHTGLPRLLPLQVPQFDRAIGSARGQTDVGQIQRDGGLRTEDYRPHIGVVSFSQSRRRVEERAEQVSLQWLTVSFHVNGWTDRHMDVLY